MPNLSKTKVLIFIIVVLLLANIAMLVFFVGMKKPDKRNADRGDRGGPNSIHVVLKDKVGFSEAQMDSLERLRKEHWEKMRLLFEDIRNAKIEFYGNIGSAQVNDSSLEASAANIGDKQKAIDLQTFRNFREVRAICTPEQLPRYDSLVPGVIKNLWFSPRKGNRSNKDSSKGSDHGSKKI